MTEVFFLKILHPFNDDDDAPPTSEACMNDPVWPSTHDTGQISVSLWLISKYCCQLTPSYDEIET